ncbi:MAG: hypothetical protein Q9172_005687 [Xanthocarpia lactea]
MVPPPDANFAYHGGVPIVDFAKWHVGSSPEEKQKIAGQLVSACQRVGFVFVINHLLPPDKLGEAFAWSKKMFDLEQKQKMLAPHPPGHVVHRGYSWPGLEKVSNSMGDEDDPGLIGKLRQVADIKESYEIGSDNYPEQPNVWLPDNVLPGFRQFMTAFYWDSWENAKMILQAMAIGIGLDEDYFLRYHSGHENQLRLLHYPPVPAANIEDHSMTRMSAHSDWGSITMLYQDDCGGLEIENPQKKGEFIAAEPLQDAIVLNVGDLLQRWSNAYNLADSYTASNWFDSFHFFDQKDPTNGFVQYKNLASAAKSGLIAIDNSGPAPAIYMGVDHTTKDPAGRASVRISSKKSYQYGLFVFDIEHSPGGICGSWPAAWLLSDSGKWPVGGEIDVFEGANDDKDNKMTLHTTPGCTIEKREFSGKIETPNCDVNAEGQGKNVGCGISPPVKNGQSFGQGMNKIGGGVYATVWTSSAISIYHFPRSLIPADISSGKPEPSKWGMPAAKFGAGCKIDEHFHNLTIIFNTALCGDWAGGAWNQSATCAKKAPTCQNYVQNNPAAFKDAYWMIRSVKVYQQGQAKTKLMGRGLRGWVKKTWKKFNDWIGGDPTEASANLTHIWKRVVQETLGKRGFGDCE